MQRTGLLISLVALGAFPALVAGQYNEELWDDPIKTNNNWAYYDVDHTSGPHVDMIWHATGGVGNSGYVHAPLGGLDSAHHEQAFWPAYLFRGLGSFGQEIDLSPPDTVIKIYAREMAVSVVPIDLKGGSLHFFIGQWITGPPDKWSFFYNRTPIGISDAGWTIENMIYVGGDDQWGEIANNDPSVSPSDLFYHPEQWGFVIFGATGTPAGELAIDSFRIAPHPDPVPLLSGWKLALAAMLTAAAGAFVVVRRRPAHAVA